MKGFKLVFTNKNGERKDVIRIKENLGMYSVYSSFKHFPMVIDRSPEEIYCGFLSYLELTSALLGNHSQVKTFVYQLNRHHNACDLLENGLIDFF